MRQGRDNRIAEHDRIVYRAEHLGQGESVDVSVEHADVEPTLGQGDREIDRHRGLAHTPLSGGDTENSGLGELVEELGRSVAVRVFTRARVTGHRAAKEIAKPEELLFVHGTNHNGGVRDDLVDGRLE